MGGSGRWRLATSENGVLCLLADKRRRIKDEQLAAITGRPLSSAGAAPPPLLPRP